MRGGCWRWCWRLCVWWRGRGIRRVAFSSPLLAQLFLLCSMASLLLQIWSHTAILIPRNSQYHTTYAFYTVTHINTIILWLWLWLWLSSLSLIDRFQSGGQQLCRLLGIKESFNMWKEYNSQRIFFVHKYGRRFNVLYRNMAANSLFCTEIWPRIHCFVQKYGREFNVLYTNMAANSLFCTQTWPPIHCFVHKYGRRDVTWKRSIREGVYDHFPGKSKISNLILVLKRCRRLQVLALLEDLFLSSDSVYKFFGITAARSLTANGTT